MIIINYVLLFVSTIDTIFIILGHSLKRIKFSFINILVISLISSITLSVSMALSSFLSRFIPNEISNWLVSILLFFIGFFNVFMSIFKKHLRKIENNGSVIKFKASDMRFIIKIYLDNEDADINDDLVLSIKETIMLSLVLSIDGISTGMVIGLMGLNFLIAFVYSFIAQIIFSYLGIALSKVFKNEKDYTLISGIILIVLALLKIIF